MHHFKLTVHHIAFLCVVSCFLVSCCEGETVLYVRPDNTTICPIHGDYCLTLSEYAQDVAHYIGLNTSFLFLPGEHVLDKVFYITDTGFYVLRFLADDADTATGISCARNGSFFIQLFHLVEFNALDIHCSPDTKPVITAFGVSWLLVQDCTIRDSHTIAVYVGDSNMLVVRSALMNNNVGEDPWFLALASNVSFVNSTMANNSGSGMDVQYSSLSMLGRNTFADNCGHHGGVSIFQVSQSNMSLSGTTMFTNNAGGVIVAAGMRLLLKGTTVFEGNSASNGGAITATNSILNFTEQVIFLNNSARYGGAMYVSSTLLYISESSVTQFCNNTADSGGGALLLGSNSKLIFLDSNGHEHGLLIFQGNSASRGGALYVQDSNPLTYCLDELCPSQSTHVLVLQECFFEVPGSYLSNSKTMYFENNQANEAGNTLYGGAVDTCVIVHESSSSCGKDTFNQIVSAADTPKEISSDPYIVCTCSENGPNCAESLISKEVYPGELLNVHVIALGQRNGTVPATIQVIPNGLQISEISNPQINNTCTTLTYTVFAAVGNGTLVLYADGPCLTLGTNLTVEIQVKKCPAGFDSLDGKLCICNKRLQKYTSADACNIADQSITRDGTFWVGHDPDHDDVILYPNCPFDYCVTTPVTFVFQDCDAQCAFGRTGLLCGGCPSNLSLLLGSSRCGECSNSHLTLLIFFAAAGILLVVVLLLLNLTVAMGTINGLIFYANILAANQAIFFPKESSTYLEFLKGFIAWLNLDFGIEKCFYNGMDMYARTWLEYAFPVYIWTLIFLVFVVSHFSHRASRLLGSNPVAVLATLLLLSYTKVLRTIIEVLRSANLEYPHGQFRIVWLYDGNVPFFGGKHLVLFIFSILVLVFVFIPYTLLLLTSQWLQIKSHWKILSWLNKPQLRAFLDAYHAPYKPRHRYWNGLLLITRFVILLVSDLNTDSNPAVNLVVVFIFVQAIFAWEWVNGGVYKNWFLDLLDSFFLLNLVFLVLTTLYTNFRSEHGDQTVQDTGTTALITTAFVMFLGIVVYHGYLRAHISTLWRKVTKYRAPLGGQRISATEEDSSLLPARSPTRSYVAIPAVQDTY